MRRLAIATLVILAGLGLVGGAVSIVVAQRTGTEATARISDCRSIGGRHRTYSCTGTWIAGGSLLDGGRVVRGTVEGATRDDIGSTLPVRVAGDRAYTKSLGTPILLVCLGLPIALLGALALRRPGPRAAAS